MHLNPSARIVAGLTTVWLASSAHAAFVAQPDGSLLEDFNDGILDTVTWTTAAIASPHVATETGSELKIVQTIGFNGAYSTLANGIDETTGMSDGSGLVEPKTAGNNNHPVFAIMISFDDTISVPMGLSITTNTQ